MVDCPSDKIKTRYNDRGKGWVVVDGNRYTLNIEIGKSPNLYHAFGTYTSKNDLPGLVNCEGIAYWRTLEPRLGTDITDWEPLERQDNFIIIEGKSRQLNAYVGIISQERYEDKYMGNTRESPIIERRPSYNCYAGRNQIFGNKFVLTDVIRVDKEPDVCTLTIYKDDVIVWQADYPECPEVEQYCDDNECPPDTCRCEHGSIVCCHDSFTGEVVKRFRRYKNK